jgi:Flp pilus assembly protein protease CpaA
VDIPTVPQLGALLVATIGAVTDWRTRKIPNWLTFPAAGAGIITQAVWLGYSSPFSWMSGAVAGVISGVLGWIAAVAIMSFTKMFLKQFGHGDTKLMAAIAAFVGPGSLFIIWLYYSIIFGAYCLARVLPAIPWAQVGLALTARRAGVNTASVDLAQAKAASKETVAVAPFIALGTLAYILLEKPTLQFLGFH